MARNRIQKKMSFRKRFVITMFAALGIAALHTFDGAAEETVPRTEASASVGEMYSEISAVQMIQ